jgi:hypothetical protein
MTVMAHSGGWGSIECGLRILVSISVPFVFDSDGGTKEELQSVNGELCSNQAHEREFAYANDYFCCMEFA